MVQDRCTVTPGSMKNGNYVKCRHIYCAKIDPVWGDSAMIKDAIVKAVRDTNHGSEVDWYPNGQEIGGIVDQSLYFVTCYHKPNDLEMYGIRWEDKGVAL